MKAVSFFHLSPSHIESFLTSSYLYYYSTLLVHPRIRQDVETVDQDHFGRANGVEAAKSSDHGASMSENKNHNSTNGVSEPRVLTEVDPTSVPSASNISSKEWSRNEADGGPTIGSKNVSIATLAEGEPPSHPNIEPILPEGDENDEPEDEDTQAGAQVGAKKKRKRKPKSKRGLVLHHTLDHKG